MQLSLFAGLATTVAFAQSATAEEGPNTAGDATPPQQTAPSNTQAKPLGTGEAIPAPATEPVPAPEAAAAEPFAFGDFTWLNGNSRQHKAVLDTKYFTP